MKGGIGEESRVWEKKEVFDFRHDPIRQLTNIEILVEHILKANMNRALEVY
jgi:hypothetical protein